MESTVDISLQPVETYTPEDRSWLASRDGTDVTQTITLSTAAFTQSVHYPNGYIPSGVVLGRINGSTELYGPYDNTASDGRQLAVGFLYSNAKVRAGGPNVGAPIHWRGVIRASRLPLASTVVGGLDSAGIVDLAVKFWIR
jgi:hypothetical protein